MNPAKSATFFVYIWPIFTMKEDLAGISFILTSAFHFFLLLGWKKAQTEEGYYLVAEKFASGGLKGTAQLLGRLQAGNGRFSFLSHFHASKVLRSFAGLGSVIHTRACVTVTYHTSGLCNIQMLSTSKFMVWIQMEGNLTCCLQVMGSR